MSKKRTRHIRVMSYKIDNDNLIVNMKTRKYTWCRSVAEGIKMLERTGQDCYKGNDLDGNHKEFLEDVINGKAIGYRKVVIG